MSLRFLLTSALLAASLAPAIASSAELSVEAVVLANARDGSGQVTALVRNDGETSVSLPSVPTWSDAGGLTMKITAPDGSQTTIVPTDTAASGGDYTLAADTSVGVTGRIAPGTFSSPGTYTVVVQYAGPEATASSDPVSIVAPAG